MTVQRKRPGSTSPIALTPKVETIQTPASPPPDVPAPVAEPVIEQASQPVDPAPVPMQVPSVAQLVGAVTRAPSHPEARIARTFQLLERLVRQAETAVFTTAGRGGYTSMAALMNGALEHELERLAAEFNGGEPFPENQQGFRRGRPLGS